MYKWDQVFCQMLPCQRPFCDWNCILAGSKWFSRSSSKNILYHHCQIFCAYAPASNWICCKAQRHLGCGTWITVYISNSKVPLFSAQGYRKFHLFFLKILNNLILLKVRDWTGVLPTYKSLCHNLCWKYVCLLHKVFDS